MNFGLGREIYGGTPWMMDPISFNYMSSMLKNFRGGVTMELPDQKYNSFSLLDVSNEDKIVTRPYGDEWNPGQLDNSEKFRAVVVLNLNGPITKSGGASSVGMQQVSDVMMKASQDPRVVGFVLKTDSGGGASSAVELMVDTINQIKKDKPVYSVITKGGMAASAAYGIISASTMIFSESGQNVVGSIGTMIEFDGYAANSEDKLFGEKHIRLYATKSTMKNKAFEEALNNDNYEPLINELLDPINENFISMVGSNRPQLVGTDYDNGHTVFSKDAIGTFIDGIASFDEVVNMILEDTKIQTTNTSLINNSKKMNRQELQQNHPDLVNEIRQEGVTAERERVKSWMIYSDADLATVTSGIASGEPISESQREELLVKKHASQSIANLQADSAKPLVTSETQTNVPEVNEESEEIKNAFNFNLK